MPLTVKVQYCKESGVVRKFSNLSDRRVVFVRRGRAGPRLQRMIVGCYQWQPAVVHVQNKQNREYYWCLRVEVVLLYVSSSSTQKCDSRARLKVAWFFDSRNNVCCTFSLL